MKTDQVWKSYRFSAFGRRHGNAKAIRAVTPEFEEKTHDVLWGCKPSDYYTGKVIRRRLEKR